MWLDAFLKKTGVLPVLVAIATVLSIIGRANHLSVKINKQQMEAVQLKQRMLVIHHRLCIFRCLWAVLLLGMFLLLPLHWTVPLFFAAALLRAARLKTIDIVYAPWRAAIYGGSILRIDRLTDDYLARVIDTVQALNMKEYGYGGRGCRRNACATIRNCS